MLYRKFSIILTALTLTLNLLLLSACSGGLPYNVEELAKQGEYADADSITVYVITRYAMSEIVVNGRQYQSWRQLLQSEFDGRNPDRAPAVWRGNYVLSIGILQADNANDIMVYFDGQYSDLFALNCPYRCGSVLAFVERGVDAATLSKLMG